MLSGLLAERALRGHHDVVRCGSQTVDRAFVIKPARCRCEPQRDLPAVQTVGLEHFENAVDDPSGPAIGAELERRKELSDTRSELERRLIAFRSLYMPGSVARTKPSSLIFNVGTV